ncbi:uncharacterized protein BT62DRAFT_1003689 [Guyanagaster necrorhizus]|uniref:Chromo domain-containing protein n=1 Tax=Guyanagaster necrorhizus TaxID=856835 RepID=A0A9P8AU47_9AGAR|nr:uncharacterized protein BT62DRAFT_1003689 [Guyanagaster necrorhizus MCA 3950]KAG7447905.1 hypothetical protein BT62DRAFT_1003689 [Guyanagaster necrorhizus MCA 3950]
MTADEQEYEVESVLLARVAKKSVRSKQLIWQYRVKWKGYSSEESTYASRSLSVHSYSYSHSRWEPKESFEGSEDILDQFWARSSTNGRDIEDLSLFHVDESFYPTGPPRRAGKPKPTGAVAHRPSPEIRTKAKQQAEPKPKSTRAQSRSTKRKHSPSVEIMETGPQLKRARGGHSSPAPSKPGKNSAPLSRHSKDKSTGKHSLDASTLSSTLKRDRVRRDSPEIVPPSEEEEYSDYAFNSAPVKGTRVLSVQDPPESISASSPALSLPLSSKLAEDPPVASSSASILSHRARATNPLVKMIDNHDGMDGGISTKARSGGRSSPKKAKPGPGRSSAGILTKSKSSLLTFTKGGLQSVKGKYVSERRDDHAHADIEMAATETGETNPPLPPPTGEELLNLAGLNAEAAKNLDDYEDKSERNEPTIAQSSFALAKEKLLPTGSIASNNASAPWKSTISNTIFGPLGLASDVPPTPIASDLSQYPTFPLDLDISVKIPVVLMDIMSTSASSSSWVFIAENKGLPGKFYDNKTALQIFNTLRTGSSAAKVVPASSITEEQKSQFERFHTRLDDGALFILPVGKEVLALCSSENALFCQRLNIPPALSCLKRSVLLTRVTVENISAYADVAVPVDAFQWRV